MLNLIARYLAAAFPQQRFEWAQIAELVFPWLHPLHIRRHRAEIIQSRVRLVSAVFAVLTPAWIVVDAAVFPWPLWGAQAGLRLVAAGCFVVLAWPRPISRSTRVAFVMLVSMLAIPPLFYLVSHPLLTQATHVGISGVVANAYTLLPLVAVAGLSVFPLTVFEVTACALPVAGVVALGAAQTGSLQLETILNGLWLLALVGGVAVFSGISQLHYMFVLVSQATHDVLTNAFTRRSGEETLDLYFRISARTNTQLAVIFLDIDNFKSINDGYGHEAGDQALRTVAQAMRTILRRSDVLVRWGGEEFLVMMPNTGMAGLDVVLRRWRQLGLGLRPDGQPITASVGIAERVTDGLTDWTQLVERADQRMYQGKRSGKNCFIGPSDVRLDPAGAQSFEERRS